mmetsp:Transcript_5762/g.8673  ORF Transcript_5762/g.8673 Transcript_5762/m.8673 type:complete len:680 (+) Transcript_5762:37-2076(+)
MTGDILSRFNLITTLPKAAELTLRSEVELAEQLLNVCAGASAEAAATRAKAKTVIRQLKNRIHPLHTSAKAQDVLKDHATADKEEQQKLQAQYVMLSHEIQGSDEGRLYNQVAGVLDRILAPVLALDHGAGRSNRAKRAKIASNVFTKNAGLSKASSNSGGGETDDSDDAPVDQHGNMIGPDWDLGRNGAYDGLKVVILHEYTEEGFTGDLPVAALREKGFEVTHLKVRNKTEAKALSPTLEGYLETASQVWLISTSYNVLEDSDLDLIVRHWQQGLGVYIFGDNDPYYADANRLLARMSICMASAKQPHWPSKKNDGLLQLSGDSYGDSVVGAHVRDQGQGFPPNHLLLTGISQLYEGVTVSYVDGDIARSMGFEELLREHGGCLVVVARPSVDGCGPILVDGAFTKLFCHWGRGGSARFVRNCACWLSTLLTSAAELVAVAKESAVAAAAAAARTVSPTINLDNAYTAECAISLEDGPVALLAADLADVDQNTTDFALDNNLALARRNRVLGSQLLALNVAKLFLEQGANPFTRQPVAAVLPLVSLAEESNKQLVVEVARQLFMGGRAMDRHAFNILLSVLEEMLHQEPDHPDALRFMTAATAPPASRRPTAAAVPPRLQAAFRADRTAPGTRAAPATASTTSRTPRRRCRRAPPSLQLPCFQTKSSWAYRLSTGAL